MSADWSEKAGVIPRMKPTATPAAIDVVPVSELRSLISENTCLRIKVTTSASAGTLYSDAGGQAKRKVMQSRTERKTALKGFDKYELYIKPVQDVGNERDFINQKFRELRGRKPLVLREDFCGTGALTCFWARQGPKHRAVGVDLDPEPLEYGARHLDRLSPAERKRVSFLKMNVLKASRVRADVVVALNFSYFVLKSRRYLVNYFK